MNTYLASLDLLQHLSTVPLAPLVEALRELHHLGAADPERIRSLLAAPAAPGVRPPAAPPAVRLPSGPSSDRPDYERARKHFVEHAQRLREQAILAEKLLAGFVGEQTAAADLRRELTLPASDGPVRTLQFVLVNTLPRAMAITFRVRAARDAEGRNAWRHGLAFEPAAPHLAAGEEVVVRLQLDTRRVPLPERPDTVIVDVFGNDRPVVSLWISVAPEEHGHGADR